MANESSKMAQCPTCKITVEFVPGHGCPVCYYKNIAGDYGHRMTKAVFACESLEEQCRNMRDIETGLNRELRATRAELVQVKAERDLYWGTLEKYGAGNTGTIARSVLETGKKLREG